MSKYCEKCGSSLQDDVKFCGNCGTPCATYETEHSQPQPSKTETTAQFQTEYLSPVVQQAGAKSNIVWIGIAAALIAVAGLTAVITTLSYYLPYKLPESALLSSAAYDWIEQQLQSDLGVTDPITLVGRVQLPAEQPNWGLLKFTYQDVSCNYEITMNGDTFHLTTKADFTTGLLPGSVKRIDFQDFTYPEELLNGVQQPQSAPSSNTGAAVPTPSPSQPNTNLSYTQIPQHFQGDWFNAYGHEYTLDENCYLVSFTGDGIVTDLNGEFIRRGSDLRYTLYIPVAQSGVIYIDGERFTNTIPKDDYYILPDSNQRYLTEADLIFLTHEECCLARNEIYARHGRKFAHASIAAYFAQQDWYTGVIDPQDFDKNTNRYFNDYEIKNIQFIQQYENKIYGGSYY